MGVSLVAFSCARDVGLFLLVLFASPGLWGFACFCLIVCVGCARMWAFGLFIRWFCVRAEAPFPLI